MSRARFSPIDRDALIYMLELIHHASCLLSELQFLTKSPARHLRLTFTSQHKATVNHGSDLGGNFALSCRNETFDNKVDIIMRRTSDLIVRLSRNISIGCVIEELPPRHVVGLAFQW